MVMQVLVLAAQNAVDYELLGVATSGSTLFRQVGGSIGVAAFGAIFANQLAANLADTLPPGAQVPAAADPATIHALPPALREIFVTALTDALNPVFLTAAAVTLVAFALTWLLREVPLRTTTSAPDIGDGFQPAHDDDRLRELARALSLLAGREQRWDLYERAAAHAGVDLAPPTLWLLARLGERGPVPEAELEAQLRPGAPELAGPLTELRRRGLVGVEDGTLALTASGSEVYERLVELRCARLRELLDGWEPDAHAEVIRLVDRLGRDLVAEMPAPV